MNIASTGTHRKRSPWQVQRAVLFALVLREMQARVGGQWVGAVWTLIEPLAHVALLVTVLGFAGTRIAAGIEFPVFLVTGLVPFFLFQNLANRLMDGVEANKGLFNYRQVKPLDALLARAVVEAMMNLLVYAVTLGALAWLGYHVLPHQPLEVFAMNFLLILFGTAYGVFTAVIGHDRPRLRSLLRIAMLPLYFASGVMFPIDFLPREYIDLLLWNPLVHLVELSRHSFIAAYTPTPGVNALYPTLVMMIYAVLGLLLYSANRRRLIAS